MSNAEPGESPYALEVGARLRSVRRQKKWSLEAIEERSQGEFRASILGAYERGQRRISIRRLHRLAQLYGVPIEHFFPRDDTQYPPSERQALHPVRKRVTIDLATLTRVEAEEGGILARYVAMVQLERQDFAGRVLTIRWDDLRIIGAWFRRTPDGMYDRLEELGVLVTSPPAGAR